jgi:phage tail tape-measure protein
MKRVIVASVTAIVFVLTGTTGLAQEKGTVGGAAAGAVTGAAVGGPVGAVVGGVAGATVGHETVDKNAAKAPSRSHHKKRSKAATPAPADTPAAPPAPAATSAPPPPSPG